MLVLTGVGACTGGPGRSAPAQPSAAPSASAGASGSTSAETQTPVFRAARPVLDGPPTRRGGRAVVAVPGEAAVLDPFAPGGDTPAARDLAPLWLAGLWRVDAAGERSPWLASGLPELSDDGRRVTVRLDQAARWSDGTPVTSADVAATWRRATSRPGPWRSAYAAVSAVETPDPATAVLVLRDPGSRAWARLFTAPTGVLPARALAAPGAYDLRVSAGPFVLAGRASGLSTTWRRTPSPWPGADPALDEVVVQIVPDFDTAQVLLRTGRLDGVLPYDAVHPADRLSGPGTSIGTGEPGGSLRVLTLATATGALRDLRVRQAVALSVDRPAIADVLVRDDGRLADDLVRTGTPGAGTPYARWRRDPDAARRLLDDAGWVAGRPGAPRTRSGSSLVLTLGTATPGDRSDLVARALQVQLRDIGIQLDLAGGDADAVEEQARRAEVDLALTRWDVDVLPDLARRLGSAAAAPDGAGTSRLADAALDRLLATAEATPTGTGVGSGPAVAAATARAAELVAVLPLYADVQVTVTRGLSVPVPPAGPGGPFADVDRWARPA